MRTDHALKSSVKVPIAQLAQQGGCSDLVINITPYAESSDPQSLVRLQVLTANGRIYQHKKKLRAGSRELNHLTLSVKLRIQDAGYRASVLDPTWWSDVTDMVTKRAIAQYRKKPN